MSEQPYFLDVNIVMYAAGQDHPYKEPCVAVMRLVASGALPVVIDSEIIQEVLYRFGAQRRWQDGEVMATSLLELVPDVLPVTREVMETAVALFSEYGPAGVKARDVVHAAVMRHHELTAIISTDRHFELLPGVRRLDPNNVVG